MTMSPNEERRFYQVLCLILFGFGLAFVWTHVLPATSLWFGG